MEWRSGIKIQSKIMIMILEQDFDFDKNFEERHQISWVFLVYEK